MVILKLERFEILKIFLSEKMLNVIVFLKYFDILNKPLDSISTNYKKRDTLLHEHFFKVSLQGF